MKIGVIFGATVFAYYLNAAGASRPTETPYIPELRLACEGGNLEAVKNLLEGGLPGQEHCLVSASAFEHMDILEYLVQQRRVDINSNTGAALCVASSYGRIVAVHFLLENGAKVKVGDNLPLFNAVSRNHKAVADILISAGADPNARNGEILRTSLAVANRDIDEYFMELRSNLNLNDPTRFEQTMETAPEFLADLAFGIVHPLLSTLLNRGGKVQARNNELLILAAQYNNWMTLAKMLLFAGADINARLDESLTLAIMSDDAPMVEFLLSRGAYIYARNGALINTALTKTQKLQNIVLHHMHSHMTSQRFK